MACERCGELLARDGFNIGARFKTPNGVAVYLTVNALASENSAGTRATMFCPKCWMFFVEVLAEQFRVQRLMDGETPIEGRPVRPGA